MRDVSILLATISSLASALALVGVAVSLLLQQRQLRANQIQTARMVHLEIVRLAIENPDLPISKSQLDRTPEGVRKTSYIYLQFVMLRFLFSAHLFPEEGLRLHRRTHFANEMIRSWWLTARTHYRAESITRRDSRFVMIVDDEYRTALERSGSAPLEPETALGVD